MTTSTVSQTGLWFVLPEQMYPIALDEGSRERATRSYEHLMRTIPGLTPAQCLNLVTAQQNALATLLHEGAVYLATCVANSDARPGTLVTAQFGILLRTVAGLGDRPLKGIARRLAAQPKRRDIRFTTLPAGEALIVDEAVEDTEFDADLEDLPVAGSARCVQVILPFRDRSRIASLMLSSTNLADWAGCVDLLLTIARSVTFTDPT